MNETKKIEKEKRKIAKEIEIEKRKIAKEKIEEIVKIYDEIAKYTTSYFVQKDRKNFIATHEKFLVALKPIFAKKPVKAKLDALMKTEAPNLLNATIKLKEDTVKQFSQLYEKKTPRDFVETLIEIKEKLLRLIGSIKQKPEGASFSHF